MWHLGRHLGRHLGLGRRLRRTGSGELSSSRSPGEDCKPSSEVFAWTNVKRLELGGCFRLASVGGFKIYLFSFSFCNCNGWRELLAKGRITKMSGEVKME